jgi:hypothetical protein
MEQEKQQLNIQSVSEVAKGARFASSLSKGAKGIPWHSHHELQPAASQQP